MNKTSIELWRVIEQFDEGQYKKSVNEFFMKFCVLEDGKASERTVKLIDEMMKS